MSRRLLIAVSVFWGLGMFIFGAVIREPRPAVAWLLLWFLLCMAGGVLFGWLMHHMLRLLARFAGIDPADKPSMRRDPGQRKWHLASTLFTAAPLLYGAFGDPRFMWAALACALGPTLTLLPLHSKRVSRAALALRAAAGCGLGVAAGAALIPFATPAPEAMHAALVVALAAASWTVAYLLSLRARMESTGTA